MSSSRIFVHGLPPSLTEDDFRRHFAHFAPVTDAKFLPQRRIGYIGFKTEQDAARAVKYFNRSYIRTSKIGVELADNRLPKQQLSHSTSASDVNPLDSQIESQNSTSDNVLKRKRDHHQEGSNSKLNEYMALMKPYDPKSTVPYTLSEQIPPEPQEDVQSPPKLRNAPTNSTVSAPGPAQLNLETSEPLREDLSDAADIPRSSDTDWMRSRTSRLLGLIDEEEEENATPQESLANPSVSRHSDTQRNGTESKNSPGPLPPTAGVEESNSSAIPDNKRLFLRNLAYDVNDVDLEKPFSELGSIEELHLPRDPRSGQSKGFAFIEYSNAQDAAKAYEIYDGTIFQGRLLHILPASAKRHTKIDDYALSKLPLKKQRQIQRKSEASHTSFNWNSLFMNANAVLSSVSDRLGVSKSEILDPASTDASVKLAQAETHVIQETKNYFSSHGVDLDAFKNRGRSDTAILAKNFPYGTSVSDLKQLFSAHGEVSRVLMPPSGTISIVEFELPIHAKSALSALAYSKYRDSILFLEKAPKDLFRGEATATPTVTTMSNPKLATSDLFQTENTEPPLETSTLYIRNLNFVTTNQAFKEAFRALDGFISARIKTKSNPNNHGNILSMGFGFVEFRSAAQAKAALAAINGYNLDGHQLVAKISHRGLDAGQERKVQEELKRRQAKHSKLVIKNLPFEASKKDVRSLFRSYGQLRAIRVPKKFDNSRKGYAFAEFSNPREAENALETLKNTHLLGRRLVIDYAAEDVEDPESEIAKMQQKASKQSNNVALQRLAGGSERKKFNIAESGQENDI